MNTPRHPKSPLPTALITGGNRGLGFETARAIARRSACRLVLACRDVSSGEKAAQALHREFPEVRAEVLELNLASLASVRKAVETLTSRGTLPLDAVICNAGTWRPSNGERSEDGFELTFASNHLGHFLLVNLLLPHLTQEARLLVVSSALHDPQRWKGGPSVRYLDAQRMAFPELDPVGDVAPASGGRAYATSKLCNVLFSYELARRLEAHPTLSSRTVNAFNPGLMAGTGLNRSGSPASAFVWKYVLPRLRRVIPGSFTPQQSGEALAALARDAEFSGVSGRYFGTLGEEQSSAESHKIALAAELWQGSLELSGLLEEERVV